MHGLRSDLKIIGQGTTTSAQIKETSKDTTLFKFIHFIHYKYMSHGQVTYII